MDAKQVTGIMEAYQAVYAPQELNEVEFWVNSLLEEGYDLSEYTWEEMYDTYLVNEFNTIVGGLIEEGYDLSEYTEQEVFDALISENLLKLGAKAVEIASKYGSKSVNAAKNVLPKAKAAVKASPARKPSGAAADPFKQFSKKQPKQLGLPKAPSSSVPYGNRTLTGTPPRPALPAAAKAAAPPKGGALAVTPKLTPAAPSKGSTLAVTPKSTSSSMTAPLGSKSNPINVPIKSFPGGSGGNKGLLKKAGLVGLGAVGLAGLASLGRGGGNETGAGKNNAPLVSTTVPGKGGSPRRKEQLVGQKGDLKATDPVVADARKLNKMGGVSLGSGGTGYLAVKGDKLVNVQAKGIGADDGIIGKAARALGLTKGKDKALEAQRQNTSRANREKYLQGQELTDRNVTGYQAKGAVRKGEKTGLNIKSSYEYDRFDTILEYLMTEGYAATEEAALAIMGNMGEGWTRSIIEQLNPDAPGNTHSLADLYKAQDKWKRDQEKKKNEPKSGGGAASQVKGV